MTDWKKDFKNSYQKGITLNEILRWIEENAGKVLASKNKRTKEELAEWSRKLNEKRWNKVIHR